VSIFFSHSKFHSDDDDDDDDVQVLGIFAVPGFVTQHNSAPGQGDALRV